MSDVRHHVTASEQALQIFRRSLPLAKNEAHVFSDAGAAKVFQACFRITVPALAQSAALSRRHGAMPGPNTVEQYPELSGSP
jgi:hypothetical protein